MSHEALVLDDAGERPSIQLGEGAAAGLTPMAVSALFVWACIVGADANPTARYWDALFALCTLLLVGSVARAAASVRVVAEFRPHEAEAPRAPSPGIAAAVLRAVALGAAIVGALCVWTMWSSGDPRVSAAAATTLGGLLLRHHLAR